MKEDCVFCKIVAGEVPGQKIHEDAKVIAISDINPVAPVHVLIIPKKHLGKLEMLNEEEMEVAGYCFQIAPVVARAKKILNEGYRLVLNQGENAGQELDHLHLHLLAGRNLKGMG
ncbi:MAG: histidine triad nucleotide-binding protein [Dehalococcoidia bacterium]|nr:histidine triad nucleotide-binding protein [Dehalococcoidia bacterium]|tara:strand:- start:1493 stop:1837 length:345 start_codon:yes stop_codon:yes gene_type:complete